MVFRKNSACQDIHLKKDKNLIVAVSFKKNILITGGAGFIGSHLVHHFLKKYPHYHIINLDALTYAGNLENLKDIQNSPNYTFVKSDIKDQALLSNVFQTYKPDKVIHLAAETHVDRSIRSPKGFVHTNIVGTFHLLESALSLWRENFRDKLFYHISTDEVFGSLGLKGFFTEGTPYNPQSPYSASKAASDHMVRAFGNTYGLPFVLSNCSNNYGPNQSFEKLIPLFIHNIKHQKPLPVYGDGNYLRDWLYVSDHIEAMDLIFHKGKLGESYNIGANNECSTIDLARLLCKKMDRKLNKEEGTSEQCIRFVKNRPGHDFRYAIDASKIKKTLGWMPSVSFEEGLELTIDWYLENQISLDRQTLIDHRGCYEVL